MDSTPEIDIEIPAGLVKIDAPDTLQGYKLVEIGSAEHLAAKPKKKARQADASGEPVSE